MDGRVAASAFGVFYWLEVIDLDLFFVFLLFLCFVLLVLHVLVFLVCCFCCVSEKQFIDGYFWRAAFFLAAHRAFISWESLFRPAGVSPPFFRVAALTPVRFRFAHRAFAAAESFALVAADIPRRMLSVDRFGTKLSKMEARRFSRVPIWRRIDSASSNPLRDVSMRCE